MAIGIFTLRQQLRGLLSTNWPGAKTPYVEYLVVGGGGGGGGANSTLGGGGGGGGVLTGLLPVVAGATNNVTVGGGGAAGTGNVAGSQGVNSVLNSVIAVGGGNGGNQGSSGVSNPGGTGGSGGGSGLFNVVISQGIFGQGNSGGAGYAGSANTSSGGGGAGTVGFGPTTSVGGNGGAGIASAISGTVATYGGGGGGAGYSASSTTAGTGGVGGGGAGSNNGAATAGQANTGGGGGGAGAGSSVAGGAGGSGIVIVSYPDVYAALASTSGSPTVSTSGSGSIKYEGTAGQGLVYTDSALNSVSGDFTIEYWCYFSSLTGATNYPTTFSTYPAQASNYIWAQIANGTSTFAFATNTGNFGSHTVSLSTWYHHAIVRVGSTLTAYVNGVATGSTQTYSATLNLGTLGVGCYTSGTTYTFNGYVTNFRVATLAVYTGNFSSYVPTAPLTATQPAGPSGSNIAAITGTSTGLLLNSVSGSPFADSSSNSATVAPVSTAPAWNQLSPFATGLGYKNRVYTWAPTVSAGSSATGTFTV
jgi:hypothetical protein